MTTDTLRQLMLQNPPNISYQKRKLYRPAVREVKELFHLLNKEIFNNRLPLPKIKLFSYCRNLGFCVAYDYQGNNTVNSRCFIGLRDKWYSKQWLIVILAHEMCHQYQWDILGRNRLRKNKKPILSHGPSFFVFSKKLKKVGIPLRRQYSIHDWFKYQNFSKC